MKKIKLLSVSFILSVLMISLSSSVPINVQETNAKISETSETGSKVSNMTYKQFVALTPHKCYEIFGTKLNFKERMSLKLAQQKIRTEIKNKAVDENALVNYNMAVGGGESSFNIGGFILGFLFGLIGVGLAYIFSNDSDFHRSTWKGFGAWIILLLVLVLI